MKMFLPLLRFTLQNDRKWVPTSASNCTWRMLGSFFHGQQMKTSWPSSQFSCFCQFWSCANFFLLAKKVSNPIFYAKKNGKIHKLTKTKMKLAKKKTKRKVVSRSFSKVELRVLLFLTGNRNFSAAKSAVLKNYFRFRKLTASAQPQKVTTPN